jgi:hypothetical protein
MGCDYYTHYSLSVTFKDGHKAYVEVAQIRGWFFCYPHRLPPNARTVVFSDGKFVRDYGFHYDPELAIKDAAEENDRGINDILTVEEIAVSTLRQ